MPKQYIEIKEIKMMYIAGLSEPEILADQLTLSQPGEQIMPTPLLRAPPRIFRPCDGPALLLGKSVVSAYLLASESAGIGFSKNPSSKCL